MTTAVIPQFIQRTDPLYLGQTCALCKFSVLHFPPPHICKKHDREITWEVGTSTCKNWRHFVR